MELGFHHSRRWLKGFLLFDVSKNTIRQEAQALWQARLRSSEPIPARLRGSPDAAQVRLEPRQRTDKRAEPKRWRDLKVGCWYEAEPVPPSQHSTRQRAVSERGQLSQRAMNIRYYCDLVDAQTFGPLMWAIGCAAQADRTRELAFVRDGAAWIWNLITTHYPHAVQIVN